MRRRGFGGHSIGHGFHRGQHGVPIGRIVEIRVALEESAEEADGERANLPRVPVCLPGRERSPRIVRVLLVLAVDIVVLVDLVVVDRGVGFVQLCLVRPRGGFANIRARGEHLHRHGQQRVQVRLRVLRHHLQQVTRGAKKTGGNLTPRSDQPGNLRLPRHPKPRRRHLLPAVPARGHDERVEPRGGFNRRGDRAVRAAETRLHRGDDRVNQRHNLRRIQSTDPTQRRDAVRREPTGASLQPRQQAPHDQRGERGPVRRVDDGPPIVARPRFDAQRD
mmetsp:Transcript_10738/g.44649  ORF Transcript_10738/g.44649 Transcript_10738/m.44649 type:complete len:277 (+) Transcript_10738:1083-1913(+)